MVKTHTPYDSRLLLNLVKAEKEVQDAFKGYTNTCEVANNALNGWAAADTGDSPDVLNVSNRVCELFDEAFDAQKTYLIGLNNYRSSLKDVAAREAEIRIILRDREIFVSRLVKLNSKKTPTSDSAFEAHSGKLEEARAELAACESTLKSEERALVGVKRRIFREALRMRMRAMAQLADTWRDTADRSIAILDSLEGDNTSLNESGRPPPHQQPQPPPPTQVPSTPASQRHSRAFSSITSPEGSVIAPSHSASQVARRAAGFPDDYSDDGYQATALGMNAGGGQRTSNLGAPIVEEEEERGGSSDEEERADRQNFQVHHNKPLTPKQIAEQKARERQAKEAAEKRGAISPTNTVTPGQGQTQSAAFPTQQAAPRAPAPGTLTNNAGAGGGLMNGAAARKRVSSAPSLAPEQQQQQVSPPVSNADNPAAAARQRLKESQEERQRRFASLGGGTPEVQSPPAPVIPLPSASGYTVDAYKKKTAPEATMYLPSSDARTTSYRAIQDSDEENDEVAELQSGKGGRRRTVSSPVAREVRRSKSYDDTSEPSTARGGSRKLQTTRAPSARNSAYYERSDAGTSNADDRTERGGTKKSSHKKQKSEDSKGGLFGGITGLFKKRDLTASKSYGGRDDEDDGPASPRSKKSSGSGWGTRTDQNLSVFNKKKGRKEDDSDSDAPDPRTLVKVHNNNAARARPTSTSMSMTFSDFGAPRQPARTNKVESSTVWVPPPLREARKAMSDVGADRPPPATSIKRKSSVKSNHTVTSQAPTVGTAAGGAAPVKKKKVVRPASNVGTLTRTAGAYDPNAFVQIVASNNKASIGTVINPHKVGRDSPSLMSAVAPPSQSASVNGMHMPSAKNPSRGLSSSATSPSLSTTAAADAPLKKKKTVKKVASAGNGTLTPPSALKASATAPNLAPSTTPGMTTLSSGRPASILSAGSHGTGLTERRKSVRLAENAKLGDATYENAGGPAMYIQRPTAPSINGASSPAPQGILKESSGFAGEWNTRIARDPADYSSDEEGDEYAKIRHQLNRSEKDWSSAGYGYKGKGRAV